MGPRIVCGGTQTSPKVSHGCPTVHGNADPKHRLLPSTPFPRPLTVSPRLSMMTGSRRTPPCTSSPSSAGPSPPASPSSPTATLPFSVRNLAPHTYSPGKLPPVQSSRRGRNVWIRLRRKIRCFDTHSRRRFCVIVSTYAQAPSLSALAPTWPTSPRAPPSMTRSGCT